MELTEEKDFLNKTRSVFLWTRILNIPFWTIFSMLSVILYKDLQATAWQITAIIAIKPISSLFSPYWSLSIDERPDKLVSNLVWANILKFLPFLFFPWVTSNWLIIFSFGYYMAFARGVIPTWMEIIKINIKGTSREKVFAFGSMLDYVGSAILPLTLGWILDDYAGSWRWIFFGTALTGIFSTLLIYKIPIAAFKPTSMPQKPTFSWKQIAEPWKQSLNLVRQRADFAHYQVGFMLGGSALMMMQTALPMFYVDVLHLTYTEILMAVAVCKSIGFALMTPSFVARFDRVDIYRFTGMVTLFAAAFPLLMFFSVYQQLWVYAAYLVYGMMQAGSELSWHMSGPIFAKEQDSAPFSRTNVLTVGLRGCVAPFIGSLIYSFSNSIVVMLIAFFLCLLAAERMRAYSKLYAPTVKSVA